MNASNFYKFSKEQLNKARNVDLGKYLMDTDPNRFYEDENGYTKDKQKEKFKVDRGRNKYFMNQECKDAIGNPIEYLDKIVGMGFVKAVETLLAYADGNVTKMPVRELNTSESSLFEDDAFAYYQQLAEEYLEYEEQYGDC